MCHKPNGKYLEGYGVGKPGGLLTLHRDDLTSLSFGKLHQRWVILLPAWGLLLIKTGIGSSAEGILFEFLKLFLYRSRQTTTSPGVSASKDFHKIGT